MVLAESRSGDQEPAKTSCPEVEGSSSSRPSLSGREAAMSPVPVIKAGGRPQMARPSSAAENINITPLPTRKIMTVMTCVSSGTKRSRSDSVGSNRVSPVPTQERARVAPCEDVKGRIKAPPVCAAPSLKREASTSEDLASAAVCFSQGEAASRAEEALLLLRGGRGDAPGGEISPKTEGRDAGHTKMPTTGTTYYMSSSATVVTISSASSCGQGTAAPRYGPPLEVVRTGSTVGPEDLVAGVGGHSLPATPRESSSSSSSNASYAESLVATRASRQGRSLQRWLVRPATGELVRRAAGTIPLTRDGRVVLISAGRKEEWIFPKGGWDADETMEECAVRETFEEAGLLGRLGGRTGPLDYPAGKAKRERRREGAPGGSSDRGCAARPEGGEDDGPRVAKRARTGSAVTALPAIPALSPTEQLIKVPEADARAVDPKGYSYVRLHLFPLYVTDVRSDWPEGGRLRRMVDVDEAIEIMTRQGRPYFRRGLEIVKEKGLHLPPP